MLMIHQARSATIGNQRLPSEYICSASRVRSASTTIMIMLASMTTMMLIMPTDAFVTTRYPSFVPDARIRVGVGSKPVHRFPTRGYMTALLASPSSSIDPTISSSPKKPRTANQQEKYDWMQKRLQLTDAQVERMAQRHPQWMNRDIENSLKPTIEWLQSTLALNHKQVAKMVIAYPPILGYSIDGNLKPTLDFLKQELQINDKPVAKMVVAQPPILGCSIDNNLKPKLDYLRHRLDLDDTQLQKVVTGHPSVLFLSIPNNLEPKIQWLESITSGHTTTTSGGIGNQQVDEIEVNEIPNNRKSHSALLSHDEIIPATRVVQRMLVKNPSLFNYNIESKLQPIIEYLTQRMDLTPKQLAKIVSKTSSVLTFSIETNIKLTLDWLASAFHLRTPEALRRMVHAMPSLLGFSIPNNLEPTLDFYVNCFGGNQTTAIEFATKNPSALTNSLEKRLRPRLAQVVDRYPSVVVGGEDIHDAIGGNEDAGQSMIGIVNLSYTQVSKLAKFTPQDWNATIASGQFLLR